MNLNYFIASIENLTEIMSLIKSTVFSMEQVGIYQWDKIYPDEATIK